ncbi:MAG TPA: hypothetical protein VFS08_11995 [Gemmatimonadaceae bacterium]|nr:hypothetical protein [Gemmatimonadaceae bacterium]
MNAYITGPRLRRAATAALLAALPLAGLTACEEVDRSLAVTDPDIINPGDVNSAAAAEALRLGAIARLNQATSGGESFWLLGGLMADEWRSSDTFVQRDQTDQRAVEDNNANVSDAFRSAQRAFLAATIAGRELGDFEQPGWQVGEMHVIQAYIENLLGEHMCNGIPFSVLNAEGAEEYSPRLTTSEVFERAIAHADSAIAAASGDEADDERVRNAAAVMKARALVNLGRYAEAAAAVADVPTDFEIVNEHSQTSRSNQIWALNNSGARWTMSLGEGGNGLDFVVNDPRVPACRPSRTDEATVPAFLEPCPGGTASRPFDRATPVPFLVQQKWPERESPAAWVNGIEARLIEAEAALAGGGDWLGILNTLRAGVDGLAPLTDPGTAEGRVDLLFKERAFWLFSTGHRLGDLRRLIRQYGRAEDDVFPTGEWYLGASYGDDVNFPIPQSEHNNPQVDVPTDAPVCIDRNA